MNFPRPAHAVVARHYTLGARLGTSQRLCVLFANSITLRATSKGEDTTALEPSETSSKAVASASFLNHSTFIHKWDQSRRLIRFTRYNFFNTAKRSEGLDGTQRETNDRVG